METVNVYSDTLKLAADTVGGSGNLAQRLGVARAELEVWMSEGKPVPLEPFLTALDIIEGCAP
jgi:hypothetical protein